MPGTESLRLGQYYGHPRNHFWPLMAAVLEEELPPEYAGRVELLRRRGIALWDSISSCDRPGSLDSDIRDERPNDVVGLVRGQLSLRAMAFNGVKARQAYLAGAGDGRPEMAEILLPSSSPVPTRAARSFADRLAAWEVLRAYL
jgi:TDG/mug DNA glycosylase family protein